MSLGEFRTGVRIRINPHFRTDYRSPEQREAYARIVRVRAALRLERAKQRRRLYQHLSALADAWRGHFNNQRESQ